MRMPLHKGTRMGPKNEVAHSIALYGCKNLRYLEVGGGRLTRWFTLGNQRLRLDWLIRSAGFSCFGSHIHCFSNLPTDGYTYVMIIGQSAINLHTYPEYGTVSVTIVTCPGEDDDGSVTKKFERVLQDYFGARFIRPEPLGKIPLQLTNGR